MIRAQKILPKKSESSFIYSLLNVSLAKKYLAKVKTITKKYDN